MKILVTGSSGLIGSEVCSYFGQRGHQIDGVDNKRRAIFLVHKVIHLGYFHSWWKTCPIIVTTIPRYSRSNQNA